MIPYAELMQVRSGPKIYRWSEREVMLYALGVGMGADPLDPREAPFVYEKALRVVPTFATVAAWGSNPAWADMGIDYVKLVQAEQGVELHRPLPTQAEVVAAGRVASAIDKGDKGAVVTLETVLSDLTDGEPIATLTTVALARADGGFGGPSTGGEPPHEAPRRAPDQILEYYVRPDLALLYRLSGDRNALHADPEVARAAGFARPILHGLCTYGMSCRAVLEAFAEFQSERIASHRLRFSAPVFPGETLLFSLWRDGNVISIEGRVKERDVVVARNGRSLLRDAPG